MIMRKSNSEKRVKALGWKDGSVAEFLELSPQESALIEIKLALSRKLRELRQRCMTQAQLARKLKLKSIPNSKSCNCVDYTEFCDCVHGLWWTPRFR